MKDKKKALIFIGSPREEGNTSILCGRLAASMAGNGYEVETCRLYDEDIEPCYDCRACKKGAKECVVDDGMKRLYRKIEESEVIVIATPIYWLGPSAKTKLLLDRFRPYYANGKMAGKRAALVLPAGAGEDECGLTIKMFKGSLRALGVNFMGAVTARAYEAGEVLKDGKALEEIDRLGSRLGSGPDGRPEEGND